MALFLVTTKRRGSSKRGLVGLDPIWRHSLLNLGRAAAAKNYFLFKRHLGKLRPENAPFNLYFEVSKVCNLRCIICSHGHVPKDQHYKKQIMAIDTFLALSPLFTLARYAHLVGYGEPFMNPDLPEMIEIACKGGLVVDLVTNGTLLKGEVNEKLIKLGLAEITISMDSASPELFEKIRVGSDFEKIVGNALDLKERKRKVGAHRPKLRVEFVAMKQNIAELPDMVSLCKEIGAEVLFIEHLVPLLGHEYMKDWEASQIAPSELNGIFAETKARAKSLGVEITNSPLFSPFIEPKDKKWFFSGARLKAQKYLSATASERKLILADYIIKKIFHAKRAPKCIQPWSTLYLTWDGIVRTCCIAFDGSMEHTLGRISEEPMESIWRGDRYRLLRRSIVDEDFNAECAKCIIYERIPRFPS